LDVAVIANDQDQAVETVEEEAAASDRSGHRQQSVRRAVFVEIGIPKFASSAR